MKEFQRILSPLKYANNIDHLFKTPEKNQIPIISCKNKKKNFYGKNKISNYNDNHLASLSWRKTEKFCGDHLTINMMSKLPAWNVKKNSFLDIGLQTEIVNALNEAGFVKPTNIQLLTIPTITKGFNTIIGGETGCGKTLAFVSSILNILSNEPKITPNLISPRSLIIAPSWELCHQLNVVVSSLASILNINSNLFKNNTDINFHTDIVISTPHTINSGLKTGFIRVDKLKSLVIDEADVILEDSFSDVMVEMLSKLSIQSTRPIDDVSVGTQMILCNATSPPQIEEAFGKFVPIETFCIFDSDDMHKLIPSVSHKFIRSTKQEKSALIITLLKNKGLHSNPPTIIFCNTSQSIKAVSCMLSENGINHVTLCKHLPFETRFENFECFQNGKSNVLLCTDLGSRGLDTSRATHVINYEFPRFISDYLHRAGRIGRVGSTGVGKVTSIISSKNEVNAVNVIERSIRMGVKIPNIDTSTRTESV